MGLSNKQSQAKQNTRNYIFKTDNKTFFIPILKQSLCLDENSADDDFIKDDGSEHEEYFPKPVSNLHIFRHVILAMLGIQGVLACPK